MSCRVRPAQPADLPAVERLTVEVYVSEGYTAPERTASLLDTGTRVATTLLLVAETSGGQLCGAVSYIGEGGPLRQIAGEDEGEFRLLAVHPSARGQGAGEALVRACIDAATAGGKRALVLSTQPSMRAAHRLYERLGFVRAPARDWQRPSGPRMLVYALPLSPDQRAATLPLGVERRGGAQCP